MFLLNHGGWVMWPLLCLSVCACAVILERWIFYASMRCFRNLDIEKKTFELCTVLEREGRELGKEDFFQNLCDLLPKHSLFANFSEAITRQSDPAIREILLQNAGQDIVHKFGSHLDLLALIAKIAPLMGLLGTVIGMIDTFVQLENIQGGIDMRILSGGIWQALLTTAVGLIIAIPSWFALQVFTKYRKNIAGNLEHIARSALAVHLFAQPSSIELNRSL